MEEKLIVPEVSAKITQIAVVEHNINDAKDYALKLKERYETIVFSSEQKAEAKKERAKINNIEKNIKKYKDEIVSEYNKPINKFIEDAESTRKLLKEASGFIDVQVKKYEKKEKEEKRVKIEEYFNEHAAGVAEFIKLDSIFDKRWLNITTTINEVHDEIDTILSKINVDIKTIEAFDSEYAIELLDTYSTTLDIGRVLEKKAKLEEKKKKLDEIARKIEESKDVKDDLKEIVPDVSYKEHDEKINTNDAIVGKSTYMPLKETYRLEITGTTDSLEKMRKFMLVNGITYKKIEEI